MGVGPGGYVERAVAVLRSGGEALGERLLILGDGPFDIDGTLRGVVGLDRHGLVVSVVAVAETSDVVPQELADHLARIAVLREEELAGLAGLSAEDLRRRHAETFGLSEGEDLPFNADQRAIVVLDREPSSALWTGLAVELGSRLDGVFLVRDGVADRVRGGGSTHRPAGPRGAFLRSRWGAVAVTALVSAGLAVAVTGWFGTEEPQVPVIEGFVSTVAVGVPGDATHTQWVGQHHIVRTSDDRLHVLYASAGRLHIVSDRANGGRTWEQPIAVPQIRTTAFSVAVDGRDRLLLAYTDDRQLRFTALTRGDTGWLPGAVLTLDAASASRVVDIAWDATSAVAHVVWAAGDETRQRPQWAAVAVGEPPRVIESRSLAPAGGSADVLVSVAVTPDSEVLTAYRRADRGGFYSRSARLGSSAFVWGPEETVPTDASFGAESLVVDERGTAHLALRNDVDPSILYFRRPPGEAWEEGEVAVAAPSSEEIDLPALSVDERSGLVYLFFQNAAVDPSPQIRVLVRDPVDGWLGSYAVIHPGAVPNGANFPIAAGAVTGSASVLWTRKGPVPDIQIARFIAP